MPSRSTERTQNIERPRVVIVDDEPLARDCIRLVLAGTAADVVAECGDGREAVDVIQSVRPDIVFLDVQMPALDGFQVVEQVGVHEMPVVVFVTAFNAHALRAFDVHALDYVLKPFDDARLLEAFDRATSRVADRKHGELGRRLSQFLQDLQAGEGPDHSPTMPDELSGLAVEARDPAHVTRFTVREDGRARFIPVQSVDWIEAQHNSILLHVGENTHRLRGSLRELTERLDPRTFVRVHKSAMVNVERIRELQPWFGGDYVAILHNGTKVKVSRRRVAALLRPMA